MEKIWLARYPKEVPADIHLSPYTGIVDVFRESVAKFRDRSAFENMGCSMTYREVERLSDDFASFLQNQLHLRPGDRIALQMPNVLQFPIAMFGAFKAGLVVVNTNPLYTEREMRHQFIDSGCKAIVILANFASHLEKILSETPIEHVVVTELGDMLPQPKRWLVNFVVKHVKKMVPAFTLRGSYSFRQALMSGTGQPLRPVPCKLQDLALLQYTGGTTGVSKGAMLTHENVVANMQQICAWMLPLLKEGKEIAICALPLYHIFCLTVNALAFMKYGGTNILITNPKDIGQFIKTLRQYKFTILTGVNTLFNALMNHSDFKTVDWSHLKISVAGGMALQTAVAERWQKLTRTKIGEGYGLTEASPVVCCNPVDGTDRLGTIGLPLPSTEIKLIDDDGKEVTVGQAGELCVRGPQVMAGYWQKPEETRAVLDNERWLRTGDVAQADADGFFKIVDRKKDMILVSGFNVYPNEIEDVIAMYPGVAEVAAIGVPDEKSGEAVKVFVVKKDPELTAEKLMAHAKSNLTAYKVPKSIEFQQELPKTNIGKILRRALRDH